jgi:metal-responsive CopG/Arc/MetJ family transcriptional regulator
MKATLEIPDQLFRRVEETAAERGQSLREFVAEALQDKLSATHVPSPAEEPAWMQGFGQLKHLHEETVRIQSIIDEEFEVIEPEDRR